MATPTTVKLEIPSQVKLIDLVHSATEKMAEVAGFDEDDALNLGLAVREATINAIVHGNGQDPTKKVDVVLRFDQNEFSAAVRDYGGGFDPDATPDPTAGANLLMTSGRGLLLIRAFVDDVEFQRRSAGMEIKMTKRKKDSTDSED